MEFFALADDLTGALEVGAKYASAGVTARVVTLRRVGECGAAEAMVVDTETRHATPEEARDTVERVASAARFSRFVYKKTDSTLRGNIAPELAGLSAVFPGQPIVYVPGYPEMGRTVVRGRLFVDGIPVSDSAFAEDALNPVESDDVAALVGTWMRAVLLDPDRVGGVSEPVVYIVNTATESDEWRAADEFRRAGLRLAAGPAGFAARLAELLPARHGSRPARPHIRRCLLVNGSLHPRSSAQVHAAAHLWRPARGPEAAIEAFTRFPWVLLEVEAAPAAAEHAERLGRAVARVLQESEIDGVVAFGGDTVFSIVHELGEPPLDPTGDVVPGMPAARIELDSGNPGSMRRGLCLVTKAGGFGPTDVLLALAAALGHS